MKLNCLLHLTALALAASVVTASAQNYSFNFDGLNSGDAVNPSMPAGQGFFIGEFTPNLDGFGDPILGSDRWRADMTAPPVVVRDPNFYGRGNAPSPINALDAVFDPTLLLFSTPTDLVSFSLTLDADTFGTSGLSIEFYSTGVSNDVLLASIPIDQTIPGFFAALGAPITGVDKIYLPAGALYDNVVFSVPEPSTYALLALGGLGTLALRFRRR